MALSALAIGLSLHPASARAESDEWNLHLDLGGGAPVLGDMLLVDPTTMMGDTGTAPAILGTAGIDWQILRPFALELEAGGGHVFRGFNGSMTTGTTWVTVGLGFRLRLTDSTAGYATEPAGDADGSFWLSAHAGYHSFDGPQFGFDVALGYEWSAFDPVSIGVFAKSVFMIGGDRPELDAMLYGGVSFSFELSGASIPTGRYGVAKLEIEGAEQMDRRSLAACLATYERPHFGLDIGANPQPECNVPPFDEGSLALRFWRWPWTDWPLFDRSVFERDTERIERWYRARGFYDAEVLSSEVSPPEAALSRYELAQERLEECTENCEVDIRVRVVEGEPVRVRNVVIDGMARVTPSVGDAVRGAVALRAGDRFDEALYDASKRAIQAALADASYAHALVRGRVAIDRAGRTADIQLEIDPGPACVFGDITVVDNRELDADVIRSAALINAGSPFSRRAVAEAQRAIFQLGAFASVSVTPKLPEDRTDRVIPLEVSAVPGRLERFGLGAGIQAGSFLLLGTEQVSIPQWDLHALAYAELRNFLGGLRRFRAEGRPRLIFQSRQGFPAVDQARPGAAITLEFRQPSFVEPRTTLATQASWDLGPDPFQNFFRHKIDAQIGPERLFLDNRLLLALRAHYDVLVPLQETGEENVVGEVPSAYQLPFLELFGSLDLRDEPKRPRLGFYFQSGIHGGTRPLASWSYIRVTPEVRGYVPLPLGMVLAMRFAIGAMFIFESDASLDTTSQTLGPQSYRLRGGGATSVRGYLSGTLGDSIVGGLRRWEASLEVRVPLSQDLGVVLFADVGDVHAGRADGPPELREEARFRFEYLHLSVGVGVRYQTVVGPFRLDVGVQVPNAQVIGQDDFVIGRPTNAPVSEIDLAFVRFPGAIHLTIGEAF
jgi:outer membrane translocation and assembly module TamA